MNRTLRVGLYNPVAARDAEFQALLRQCPGVDVAGTVSDGDGLEHLLREGGVDALILHLGDDVDYGLNLIQHLVRVVPDLRIVGISAATDPQTIIRAMRAGCAQYVCAPVDPRDLSQALERIRHTCMGAHKTSTRVCVMGSTGGAGATTLACNLALELGRISETPVGLVDMNLEFSDITCALDLHPKYTIANLCEAGNVDRIMAESAMPALPSGIRILCGPRRLGEAARITATGIRSVLDAAVSVCPVLVVDMPRTFHAESAAALEGADLVLIVTQLGVSGVRNATRIFEYLMELGAPEEAVELVINRYKADHLSVDVKDVEKHFHRPVFARIPNDYKHVMSALDLGHPISASSPTSPVRTAIQDIARRILAAGGQEAAVPQARRGLFGRLLSKKA